MDCEHLLELTLDDIEANGTSVTQALRQLTTQCPNICDHVLGSSNFTLAGQGVFISVLFQAVATLLFSTVISYLSFLLPRDAGTATKLTLARFKTIQDLVFGTGLTVYLATAIVVYIRVSADEELGGYDYAIMGDLMWIQLLLTVVGFVSYLAYSQPPGVNLPSSTRWGFVKGFFAYLILTVVLDRSIGLTDYMPRAMKLQLCAPTTFIYDIEMPRFTSVLLMLVVVLVIAVLLLLIFPSTIGSGLRKMYDLRITPVVFFGLCVLCILLLVGGSIHHFARLRSTMFHDIHAVRPPWDLSQVLVLVVWLPIVYRIGLTLFVSVDTFFPTRDTTDDGRRTRVFRMKVLGWMLWKMNVGEEPIAEAEGTEDAVHSDRDAEPDGVTLETTLLVSKAAPVLGRTDAQVLAYSILSRLHEYWPGH